MGGEGFSLLPIPDIMRREWWRMEKRKPKDYGRLRMDSGQHRRVTLTALLLGIVAFVPMVLRLYSLMVVRYEEFSALALRNQTRSTAVTADRGTIYDRNLNVLAYSENRECLISHTGIVTRSHLLDALWDADARFVDDNTLSVHVSRLREKIGGERIKTVRGVGYQWVD